MFASISIIYPKSNIWSATWLWWVEANFFRTIPIASNWYFMKLPPSHNLVSGIISRNCTCCK